MRGVLKPKIINCCNCDGMVEGPSHDFPDQPLYFKWDGLGKPPYVIFDFGKKVAGILRTKSTQLKGYNTRLKFLCGPFENILFCKIDIPVGEWKNMELAAFRFARLSLSEEFPCPATVRLDSFEIIETSYPLVRSGSFSSDDAELNGIWKAGVDTVELCIQPNSLSGYALHYHPENRQWLKNWKSVHSAVPYTIWDGVRRDREAWLGDAFFGAHTFLYAGGDVTPILNNLEITAELQEDDGELIVSAFSRQKFIEYQLWFTPFMELFVRFSGDVKTALRFLNTFRRSQEWILRRLDGRGFIKVSKNEPRGLTYQYTYKMDGVITYLQTVLYKNLLSSAFIEDAIGDRTESEKYSDLARKVKRSINKYLWNDKGGYYESFIEGSLKPPAVAHDANAAAVLYAIPDTIRTTRILNFLKSNFWTDFGAVTYNREIPYDLEDVWVNSSWPHNRQIWPYTNVFEIEARFRTGDVDGALELTRRCFGNMVKKGPGTLWEMALASNGSFPEKPFFADCYNSACHAWGSYVSYLLQTYVGGIIPVNCGFSKVLISPNPGVLKEVRVTVPTPKGIVSVEYIIKDNTAVVAVKVPEGMEWEFKGKGFSTRKVRLTVNEKVIKLGEH